ncbi:hypothetical protein SLEP1_g52727 [Rubroshorea leprosula]|uniref:Uncharacterized protein n=1 Tax=Rubroshorea leprosula TaxID=152421 RepID=A0AAV5M9G0_9ROSI|nr:hypothetical protein SLEP1_g52727 [Rubroshorea leprosula]
MLHLPEYNSPSCSSTSILDPLKRDLTHPSAMSETEPHRHLWRRQRLQVPLGVNFRQQQLQRAMNTLQRMKVTAAAMKMKTKRMKKSHKKAKVALRRMEAEYTKLRAESRHALEESERTQVYYDTTVTLLFCPGGSAAGLSPVDYFPRTSLNISF